MHLSASHLIGAFVLVAGFTSTSAHSIHRRGSQQHHKDLAERMAQPAADAVKGDAANFYARALNDAQAGKYRITRRAANPVGRAGQKKVIRKRADGATCKIRPSGQDATESASASSASLTVAASTASEWWATSTAAASSAAAWSSSSSAWVEPSASSTWAPESSSWAEPAPSSSATPSWTSSSAAPAATSETPHDGGGTSINQVTNNVLLAINDNVCGPCDATHEFPNGSEDWINCGMKAGGWTPPHVSYDQLRVGDATALKNVYPKCSDEILGVMTQVSHETNVPAQLLLAIAIGESACDVNARGGGGEVGLMQVANNRCPNQNIPRGQWDSCMEPYNNIKLGADIFNEKLALANGNVLQALGMYNGWNVGMTFDEAHNGPICQMNRNRDYVHKVVNGFMQGIDASGWNAWGQNGC